MNTENKDNLDMYNEYYEKHGYSLTDIKNILEVCLLTATDSIDTAQLSELFDKKINNSTIEKAILELSIDYQTKPIELIELSGGYRFRSKTQYQPYLNKLHKIKPPKYSRTVMETLAIIAYRQPVTRGELEKIRGVATNSNNIQLLLERGWIEVVGTKEVPGRPELLGTTIKFLDDLGITSLQELPSVYSSSLNPVI